MPRYYLPGYPVGPARRFSARGQRRAIEDRRDEILDTRVVQIGRRRQFLLVVALPPITFGIHAAGALYGYSAVGTTMDGARTWAGIAGSMVVSVVLLWIASLIACRRAEPPVRVPLAARGVVSTREKVLTGRA